MRPTPTFFHVQVQAQLAEARIARLLTKGSSARALVTADTQYAHKELEQWIDERIKQELGVIERLSAMSGEAVEKEVALEHDWKVEGIDLIVNPTKLLVAPPAPPPEPTVVPVDNRELNPLQMAALESAVSTAASAEGLSSDDALPAVLSTWALQDLLLRIAASDTGLPEYWTQGPAEKNFEDVVGELDKADTGFVEVASVLAYFKAPPAL